MTVDQGGIYVADSGDRHLPAVVFVHGGGPSSAMWRGHMERMSGEFYCLAPDLPGFGRSNHLPSISLSQSADLVADLISDRARRGRAHIVGLSYGGSVVLALLGRHPEVVDRAIIDGASVLRSWSDRPIVIGVGAISPLVNTRAASTFLRLVGWRALGEALRTATPEAFRRAWVEGFTAPVSAKALTATCPTLLVGGEHEASVRASNAALAALMPRAEARYVRGLAHAWFVARPELHVRMVEDWLGGRPLSGELIREPPRPAAVARVLADPAVAARSAE